MWDLIVSVPDHCLSFYFFLDQLNDLSQRNPKQYWQLVKEFKELENQSSNSCSPISPEDWIRHFTCSDLLCTSNRQNIS